MTCQLCIWLIWGRSDLPFRQTPQYPNHTQHTRMSHICIQIYTIAQTHRTYVYLFSSALPGFREQIACWDKVLKLNRTCRAPLIIPQTLYAYYVQHKFIIYVLGNNHRKIYTVCANSQKAINNNHKLVSTICVYAPASIHFNFPQTWLISIQRTRIYQPKCERPLTVCV